MSDGCKELSIQGCIVYYLNKDWGKLKGNLERYPQQGCMFEPNTESAWQMGRNFKKCMPPSPVTLLAPTDILMPQYTGPRPFSFYGQISAQQSDWLNLILNPTHRSSFDYFLPTILNVPGPHEVRNVEPFLAFFNFLSASHMGLKHYGWWVLASTLPLVCNTKYLIVSYMYLTKHITFQETKESSCNYGNKEQFRYTIRPVISTSLHL